MTKLTLLAMFALGLASCAAQRPCERGMVIVTGSSGQIIAESCK